MDGPGSGRGRRRRRAGNEEPCGMSSVEQEILPSPARGDGSYSNTTHPGPRGVVTRDAIISFGRFPLGSKSPHGVCLLSSQQKTPAAGLLQDRFRLFVLGSPRRTRREGSTRGTNQVIAPEFYLYLQFLSSPLRQSPTETWNKPLPSPCVTQPPRQRYRVNLRPVAASKKAVYRRSTP
jgi:hypothetical protein